MGYGKMGMPCAPCCGGGGGGTGPPPVTYSCCAAPVPGTLKAVWGAGGSNGFDAADTILIYNNPAVPAAVRATANGWWAYLGDVLPGRARYGCLYGDIRPVYYPGIGTL